jgi:ADP-heptose:LPS heptosyltransferase
MTKQPERFLIFNNGMIGNTLFNMPAAAWLKREYPGCFVGMVVDRVGLSLVRTDPSVDAFHVFEKKKTPLRDQLSLVLALRRERYDVSLHLRTGVRNEIIALLAGVRLRAGFRLRGSWQHLHVRLDEDRSVHRLRSRAQLMATALRRPVELERPRLYPDAEAEANIAAALAEAGTGPGGYLVLHPTGNTVGGVGWSLPVYARAVRELAETIPVFILCMADERATVEKAIPSGGRVRYYIGEMAAISQLIRQAAYFVGNDSGPAHLACAWGVERLVVYGDDPANFAKWRPVDETGCTVLFRRDFTPEAVVRTIHAALDNA